MGSGQWGECRGITDLWLSAKINFMMEDRRYDLDQGTQGL